MLKNRIKGKWSYLDSISSLVTSERIRALLTIMPGIQKSLKNYFIDFFVRATDFVEDKILSLDDLDNCLDIVYRPSTDSYRIDLFYWSLTLSQKVWLEENLNFLREDYILFRTCTSASSWMMSFDFTKTDFDALVLMLSQPLMRSDAFVPEGVHRVNVFQHFHRSTSD